MSTTNELAAALDTAPKRGRPPIPDYTPEPLPAIPAEVEARLEADAHAARTIDAAVDAALEQQTQVATLAGQIQAFDCVRKMADVSALLILKQIKETKKYKGFTFFGHARSQTVSTWEEFCTLVVGCSRQHADEQIQNLNVFGEEFMESAQRLGLGYRDLRKLRALPADDQALIIEGEKVGNDPDALKDLLEELAAKRAKDRDVIKEAKADKDALEKVLTTKNKALDAAQTELAKLKNLPPDERVAFELEKEGIAIKELQAIGFELLGVFGKYTAKILGMMSTPGLSGPASTYAIEHASHTITRIADILREEQIDVDFRQIAYPAWMGEVPLRGDTSAETVTDTED